MLIFLENLEFKYIELMNLEFSEVEGEKIRENITYRYNLLKAKMLIAENRLKDLNA